MFHQAQRRGVEGGAESRCPHRRTKATPAGRGTRSRRGATHPLGPIEKKNHLSAPGGIILSRQRCTGGDRVGKREHELCGRWTRLAEGLEANSILQLSAMSVRNKSAYYNDTKRYHTCRVCFLQVEKETEQKIGRGTRGQALRFCPSVGANTGKTRN